MTPFPCPFCSAPVDYKSEDAGQLMRCSRCGNRLELPTTPPAGQGIGATSAPTPPAVSHDVQ